MPNAKVLEEKKQLVANLSEKFKNSASGVLVDYQGIDVGMDTKMRSELRAAGVDYFVFKNTLARFAAKECGFDDLLPALVKMTAIAVSSNDPVAPAKILTAYADKIQTFNIKAGFVEGSVIDADGVNRLATLPSKEELVAKALGSLQSPIYGLVNVLNGNLRGLACVLQAICDKKSGSAEQEA
ncbi:MAG: 50S ribosomal protein L10 [Oscillospiraceae bacterium]|nr:50S ribosomal protein L10 [Oscillospiraceae bacterium]